MDFTQEEKDLLVEAMANHSVTPEALPMKEAVIAKLRGLVTETPSAELTEGEAPTVVEAPAPELANDEAAADAVASK